MTFHLARLVVLGGLFALFAGPTLALAEPTLPVGATALVWLSLAANLLVIAYHYTVPAHPKFLMLPRRRAVLRVHIVSGTVELVAGLWAFTHPGDGGAARVMACAALLAHVPSALAQTSIVFGSRAIMVPAYVLCIAMHAACAIKLALVPTSSFWAMATFLIFNVYAWVRVYFFAFERLRLFEANHYTLAVLAAGATLVPAVFGALSFLFIALFVAVDIALHRAFRVRTEGEYVDLVRERSRASHVNPGLARVVSRGEARDDQAAQRAFALLDANGDGVLEREELERELTRWGVPAELVAALVARHVDDAGIRFPSFLAHVWSVGAVRGKKFVFAGVKARATTAERARFVFDLLDHDRDGVVTPLELGLLLLEWGLPHDETEAYVAAFDTDRDGRIDFDEFRLHMKPIWRFLFEELAAETRDASSA
jgi:Ca2+-binding EF-hand superfamily protein